MTCRRCPKEAHRRHAGYCRSCYMDEWRKGTIGGPNRKRCSEEGCETVTVARGWCRKHYERWKRTGTPQGAFRTNCEIPGCLRKHYGHGLCRLHYGHAEQMRREPQPKNHRLPLAPLKPYLERAVERFGYHFAAERLTITEGHLQHLLNRNKSLDLDTADRICLSLGLPFDALFNEVSA